MPMGQRYKNIAKGTTDPRVEFLSQIVTQILIELHFAVVKHLMKKDTYTT